MILGAISRKNIPRNVIAYGMYMATSDGRFIGGFENTEDAKQLTRIRFKNDGYAVNNATYGYCINQLGEERNCTFVTA